ncbi:MAG: AAA family ATPase [Deltaproteobacteria bacterium]|nr:AAA family ATPase [Deltaproteobacteria bacterium]
MRIKSLTIKGLRGIAQGTIPDLAPMTILLGPNGCGKSTVLEAAGVACAGPSASASFAALSCREWLGVEGMRYWVIPGVGAEVSSKWLLDEAFEGDTPTVKLTVDLRPQMATLYSSESGPAQTAVHVDSDGTATIASQLPERCPFTLHAAFVDRGASASLRFSNPRFSSALRDSLSRIKLSAWYDAFFEYLRILRPNLLGVENIAVGDRDEPFMFEGPPRRGYPIAYAGDGFARTLLIAASLAQSHGGVCALDEPEAFAHPKMFHVLAQLLRRAIDDKTQVFIATHSLEFVEAVLREFESAANKACVVGLTMADGVLDPLVISGPDAYQRVIEWKDDLRL